MDIASLPAPLRWREATADDEELLERLFAAGREELQSVPGDAAFLRQLLRVQRHAHESGLRQNHPRALRLLIERHGEPVGHAIVDIGESELRLLDITVLPAARRAGIARAAVACLQGEAARRGLAMGLLVARANTAACALYAQQGFAPTSQDMLFTQMQWQPPLT